MLRLVSIISFTSSNSVLLIHHEFEEGRYILAVSIIVFLEEVLFIFPLHVYVYIQVSNPQINTSDIPNNINGQTLQSLTIRFKDIK
jgi:hypothetical protein